MRPLLASLLAVCCLACSSPTPTAAVADALAGDAGADVAVTDTGAAPDCAAINATLAAQTGILPGRACTAVVRLAVDTLAPDGWNFVCGAPKALTETDARAAATAGLPAGTPGPGTRVSAASPTDVYVYRQEPTDFGSFSVVAAQSGLLVLGSNLGYSAAAATYFPATWRAASELGVGCGTEKASVTTHVYDTAPDSFPATQAETDAAIAAVRATALWNAIVPMEVALVRLQFSVDGSSKATSKAQWYVIFGTGLGG